MKLSKICTAASLFIFFFLNALHVQADTLSDAKSSHTLRIAYANEAPHGFTDASGKLTGLSVDIADAIMPKVGITTLQPVLTEWGSLIPSLQANRVDMVTVGMYITPERCRAAIFSAPTHVEHPALLVLKGNPKHLVDWSSFRGVGETKLAVNAGGFEPKYLRQLGVPQDRYLLLPDQATMLAALRAGRVDAITGPASVAAWVAKKNPDLAMLTPFSKVAGLDADLTQYGAFVFRQQDTALRDAVNQQLKSYLGSPEHLKLLASYGMDAGFVPKNVTADEICHRQ